jgi:hypothetical protein
MHASPPNHELCRHTDDVTQHRRPHVVDDAAMGVRCSRSLYHGFCLVRAGPIGRWSTVFSFFDSGLQRALVIYDVSQGLKPGHACGASQCRDRVHG